MTEEYKKINNALQRIENSQYKTHSLSWCADRISWAWQWNKITEEEMEELTDRVCIIYEGRIEL